MFSITMWHIPFSKASYFPIVLVCFSGSLVHFFSFGRDFCFQHNCWPSKFTVYVWLRFIFTPVFDFISSVLFLFCLLLNVRWLSAFCSIRFLSFNLFLCRLVCVSMNRISSNCHFLGLFSFFKFCVKLNRMFSFSTYIPTASTLQAENLRTQNTHFYTQTDRMSKRKKTPTNEESMREWKEEKKIANKIIWGIKP